MVRAIYVGTI